MVPATDFNLNTGGVTGMERGAMGAPGPRCNSAGGRFPARNCGRRTEWPIERSDPLSCADGVADADKAVCAFRPSG